MQAADVNTPMKRGCRRLRHQDAPNIWKHGSSREKNRASIYSAHLDGANVYNLSSLVCSHPRPAFSDLAICWKSIDKLAKALIGLPTTGRYQNGLIDAIRL